MSQIKSIGPRDWENKSYLGKIACQSVISYFFVPLKKCEIFKTAALITFDM